MPNENGTWIMYGVSWNDPECLHSVDEAIDYINWPIVAAWESVSEKNTADWGLEIYL